MKKSAFAFTCKSFMAALPVMMVMSAFALPPKIITQPSAERIKEISRYLPQTPRPDGAVITEREYWDKYAATEDGKAAIAAAADLLNEKIDELPDSLYLEFSRNGNRMNYQTPYSRRQKTMMTLAMAECLENKGRFLPKLEELILRNANQRCWMLPAHDSHLTGFNRKMMHIELGNSRYALMLAYAVAYLEPRLKPDTVKKVKEEIIKRIINPYLELVDDPVASRAKCWWHFWYDARNNWNSVCHCNVVRTALVVVDDPLVRAKIIAAAEMAVPYALEGYTNDGYCSEGIEYWNYGYGHHLELALSVRNATGGKVNFCADPKTRKIMEYGFTCQPEPGAGLNFADGAGNPSAGVQALGRQFWPELVQKRSAQAPLLVSRTLDYNHTEIIDVVSLPTLGLRGFDKDLGPKYEKGLDELPQSTWFRNAQVLISRATYDEGQVRLSLAAKGGHNNELHNHNDVGSYNIYRNGKIMTGDPQGEIYTRRTFSSQRYESKVLNSYGHPVPRVDGELQPRGRLFAAEIKKIYSKNGVDTFIVDLTKAYATTNLKSLVRTFIHDRNQGVISVCDEVEFKTACEFDSPLITYCDVVKNADNTGLKLVEPQNNGALDVKFEVEGGAWKLDEDIIENPGRPSPKRIAVKFNDKLLKAKVKMSFSPASQQK